MCHADARRGAVPVFFPRGKPDHVTRTDLLDRSAPPLSPAESSRDDERLAEGMSVPCTSRTRLERDAGALNKGVIGRLKQRIDPHSTSEPIRRPRRRRLRASSLTFLNAT